MATSSQVSVTTSATPLAVSGTREGPPGETRRFLVKSTSSTAIYVGGSGVTTSTGYLLTQNVEYPVDLRENETLYAVSASGTVSVYVWGP
jgi:hypothetical protein